jgi:UDP-glucuronate decarboxylase
MQTRSFQFIDDLVEGLIRMMNTPPAITGPINLGNRSEFTMLELANMIIQLTGSSSKLVYKELPENDPKQRQPDISLAKEKLDGWEPAIKLKPGLERTIEYFRYLLPQLENGCKNPIVLFTK